MKATGIIRRLDSLGRIVLPKELRDVLNIAAGDPIEIFTNDDGHIILRKYAINDKMTEALSVLRNAVEEYDDRLPHHVAVAMKKHCSEMKKLLEEEQKK